MMLGVSHLDSIDCCYSVTVCFVDAIVIDSFNLFSALVLNIQRIRLGYDLHIIKGLEDFFFAVYKTANKYNRSILVSIVDHHLLLPSNLIEKGILFLLYSRNSVLSGYEPRQSMNTENKYTSTTITLK